MSPAELFLLRKIRTQFNLLKPDVEIETACHPKGPPLELFDHDVADDIRASKPNRRINV